jgi:aminopeptidase N
VRRAAALAIPKLATDRRAREHLEELLDDSDPIVRMDVVRALSDLGDARSRPALRARAEIDLDARVRRRIREVVRDLGGERKQNEELKDTVERLENEQRELRARLAKLEASTSSAKELPTETKSAPAEGKRKVKSKVNVKATETKRLPKREAKRPRKKG